MEIVEVVDVQEYTEPYEQQRKHKLLPDGIVLPKLYEQQRLDDSQAMAYLKFTARNGWEWYVMEYDGKDKFYGLVYGHVLERGYFSLKDIASILSDPYRNEERYPVVNRDQRFEPQTLDFVVAEIQRGYRWKWINKSWA